MNRSLRIVGAAACLVALLVMSGGHWLTLQSVAWARMIVDFSRHDSLGAALAKTFSGQHPCAMCLKVRAGWHQEQQQEKELPGVKTEKMPELFCELRGVTAPPAPAATMDCPTFVPQFCSDFIDSPPTPPPRAGGGVV